MKTTLVFSLGGVLGAIIAVFIYVNVVASPTSSSSADANGQKPLYWVAPMDANFRRDQPGKSPMGMDLVPVFADESSQKSAGVVRISPNVVNNLGVRTTSVVRAALPVPITTVGYVQYNENNLLHVHPRVEGWVDTLFIKAAGERVAKGEPLYALYSPELVNAQEEYLLASKRGNSDLIAAAHSRLLALQMPTDSIKQLQQQQRVQQQIIFNAPQSGVIANLAIREGFYVKPGTTLLSIGGLVDVWVKAEIFERQVAQVRTGQRVSMTLEFLPGKTWQGQVDYVYPTLDAKTRTLQVRLRFDNTEQLLKPNMFAQVIIHTRSSEQKLLVPKEAVIRTATQNRLVLVTGQGEYKSVAVNLGTVTQQYAEIIQGVEEGDEVVTSAQFLLDSESSINSDFIRMSALDGEDTRSEHNQTAQVQGTVVQINRQTGVAKISRGAIEKWGRGPATIDFMFAENLAVQQVNENDQLDFTFEIINGDFVIVDFRLVKEEPEHQHD